MKPRGSQETHAKAICRAAFVVVALLVLVFWTALGDGLGRLAEAHFTLTRQSNQHECEAEG